MMTTQATAPEAVTSDPSKGSDLFSQVANEILESAEHLSNRLEDGLNVLLGGTATPIKGERQQQDQASAHTTHDAVNMQEELIEILKEQGEDWEDIDWSQVDLDSENPLSGVADSVMGDILEGQSGPQTFMEHWEAFRSAINWSEPLIVGIICFQIVMFIATLLVCRKNVSLVPRISLMVLIAFLVRSAEYMNQLAAKHWEDFSTQNYFDRSGIFVSIFLCAPLLIDSFIMLIMFLRESSVLLVQVKRAELKQKRKQNNQQKTLKQHQQAGSDGGNPKRRGKKDQ